MGFFFHIHRYIIRRMHIYYVTSHLSDQYFKGLFDRCYQTLPSSIAKKYCLSFQVDQHSFFQAQESLLCFSVYCIFKISIWRLQWVFGRTRSGREHGTNFKDVKMKKNGDSIRWHNCCQKKCINNGKR